MAKREGEGGKTKIGVEKYRLTLGAPGTQSYWRPPGDDVQHIFRWLTSQEWRSLNIYLPIFFHHWLRAALRDIHFSKILACNVHCFCTLYSLCHIKMSIHTHRLIQKQNKTKPKSLSREHMLSTRQDWAFYKNDFFRG